MASENGARQEMAVSAHSTVNKPSVAGKAWPGKVR